MKESQNNIFSILSTYGIRQDRNFFSSSMTGTCKIWLSGLILFELLFYILNKLQMDDSTNDFA